MKTRNIFGVLGLSIAAMSAAALVKAPAVKQAKAGEYDTWGIHAAFDIGEISTWDGVDFSSFVFRCGRDGYDESTWKNTSLFYSGIGTIYCANMCFNEYFEFDRVQVKYIQNGKEKWSNPQEASGDEYTHSDAYKLTYDSWDSGDNFNATFDGYQIPFVSVTYGATQFDMSVNPESNLILQDEVTFDAESTDRFKISYLGDSTNTEELLTTSSLATYFDTDSYTKETGFLTKKSGDILVILKNNNSDGGIFEIKDRVTRETNIYYVTENAAETTDFIYSWGGSQQFDSWPGSEIALLVDEETPRAREVFDYTSVYFQGKSVNIYSITINLGYPYSDPEGDLYIQFNGGDNTRQSADFDLVPQAAYWFTGGANLDASAAINYIVHFEQIRNNGSVCNISKGDATALIEEYNALSSTVKEVYVDTSKLLTTDHTNPSQKALYTYKQALETLSGEYGVPIVVPNELYRSSSAYFDSTIAITLVVATGVITITLATLMIAKRKKEK